jgi:hypothetical protein
VAATTNQQLGPASRVRRAAEYDRAAMALERSAQLADVAAAHDDDNGRPDDAFAARAAAAKARDAAWRGRLRARDLRALGEDRA